jgi:peptide/nickel transport system substrate-binding protein
MESLLGPKKSGRVGALLTALVLTLVSCQSAEPGATTVAEEDPTAPTTSGPTTSAADSDTTQPSEDPTEPTGELVIALETEPPDLGFDRVAGVYGFSFRNIGEPLVSRDPDTLELVGELALSWEAVDPTTWRFELRPGVTFHDGSEFNAEAAAASLNFLTDPESDHEVLSRLGPEMTWRAVDELTLEVETAEPDPILPERTYFLLIPSAQQIEENPDDFGVNPIGTGPYTFVEFVPGQHIKMTANPDWWGHTAEDAGGTITIEDVTVVLRSESSVRAAMTQAGEADIARFVLREDCEQAPQCGSNIGTQTVHLWFDVEHLAMRDIRVREAIALAVDRQAIMDEILGGGELGAQLVGPTALGHNPDLEDFAFDPERAGELLAEAEADGVPVDAALHVVGREGPAPNPQESIEAIAFMLQDAGFPNVDSQFMELAAFTEAFDDTTPPEDRGFIAYFQHNQSLMDYGATVEQWYTCDGGNTTFCDEELDAMYEAAAPLIADERDQAFQEIAQYIRDQYYYVPIGQPTVYWALSDRVNWTPRADGLFLLKEMTLNP